MSSSATASNATAATKAHAISTTCAPISDGNARRMTEKPRSKASRDPCPTRPSTLAASRASADRAAAAPAPTATTGGSLVRRPASQIAVSRPCSWSCATVTA